MCIRDRLSKYLNQIFVVTREIKENGQVVVAANYDDLGILLWVVIIGGFIIPIATILKFNPDPGKPKKKKAAR
jgi:uncharacterized membrane protein